MELQLYNTLKRRTETFEPIEADRVRMYCCGPTVYNFAHIGNLRTYIIEDLLQRTLRVLGYPLTHVMNITDVGHLTDDGDQGEDKMLKAAREKGWTVWDIANFYTEAFFRDCERLGIQRPDIVCKATDHITDMIKLIQQLEERGFTYFANGNLYFDVSKFSHYGELALLDKQELRAGARIEVDEFKKNPQDFVLWFTNSKFGQQAMLWDSPWGRGYPGWHIECSAMSHKYLGDQFDVHCGGVDHISVHHTNEIAQTEGATGKHPWVKYWVHAEFLILNAAKMSKSSGSFLTLDRLIEQGYDALDYRFFCLGAHYRTQLTFSDEALKAARSGRLNLVEKVKALLAQVDWKNGETAQKSQKIKVSEFSEKARVTYEGFLGFLCDDLNIPRALAALWDLFKVADLSAQEKLTILSVWDEVLGLSLILKATESLKAGENEGSGFSPQEEEDIKKLIEQRNLARKEKNYQRSDEIRDQLKAKGVMLVDGPGGTSFKRA